MTINILRCLSNAGGVRAAKVQPVERFSCGVWEKARKRPALFICSAVNINLRHFFPVSGVKKRLCHHWARAAHEIKLLRELTRRVPVQVDGGVQGKWLRQEYGSAQQGLRDRRWGLSSWQLSNFLGSLLPVFLLLEEDSSTRWAGAITLHSAVMSQEAAVTLEQLFRLAWIVLEAISAPAAAQVA